MILITIVLSAASIIYELLLATALGHITGNHVWWYSWTIAFYILGLGLGSFSSEKFKSLSTIEVFLSFAGSLSVISIFLVHGIMYTLSTISFFNGETYSSLTFFAQAIFFSGSLGLVLIIGFLSGFEIPLIIKKFGIKNTNKIIAYNYFGTLLGTLLFSFLLIPKFSLIEIAIIVSTINIIIAYGLIENKKNGIISILLFGTISSTILIIPSENLYYKIRYNLGGELIKGNDYKKFFQNIESSDKIIFYRSRYQNIHFVHGENGRLRLFIDSNFQFDTSTEKEYHESFSHVAMSKVGNIPKNVLVLGAGDGMLTRELLKYSEIESITQVELDGEIIRLFKDEYFYFNRNSLNDKRVEIIIDDAFYFTRTTKKKYDAIFIDFPYPKTYDLSRLYSIEFYKNIKRILSDSGFVVVDAPVVSKIEDMLYLEKGVPFVESDGILNNSVLMSTIYFSGFKNIKPFKVRNESFVLFQNNKFKKENIDFFENKCSVLTNNDFLDSEADFPYSIDSSNINSIFLPRIRKTESVPIQ